MGFGVRIAPGVRISASSRGIRAGIGPRAARVHIGSGRTTFSSGVGPFTYYTSAGGSRRSTSSGGRASLSALERQARAVERAEEIAEVHRVEQALVTLHLEHFEPAARPVLPAPPPPNPGKVARALRAEERAGIPWWHVRARRQSRRRAAERTPGAVSQQHTVALAQHASAQAEIDGQWARLLANHPDTVIAALEAAFEDNASPAAPIDCAGVTATVVVLFGTPKAVPERKPATTPSGRPTLHKRTKTERNQLYAAALGSTVLATVREALAVAPGLKEIRVLVVRKDPAAPSPEEYLTAVYAGRFPRDWIDRLNWPRLDPAEQLLLAPDALLRRRGSAGEIAPLDLTAERDLNSVLTQLRQSL
ncbi:MAG TPA: DUF4236 domain-containing protein [Mycobacteriales bacterium]|nr:DUF4236 domain-containing protein [Mycobacteriales bacterium]